jgi:DNA gyrase subunit A
MPCELKNDWNKPYKKSARIVGDVIGKYHPHGDSAVYDTIVRMAQDFSMRYPLVDGQGNFGSIDGDPPAAMRYTEIRMMRLAHQMLADLDKETVDFTPNYDESLTEPSVLPAKCPVAAGQRLFGHCRGHGHQHPAPQYHGNEVDAIKALIDNPEPITWRGTDGTIPVRISPPAASSTAPRASTRPTKPGGASSGCGPHHVEKDKRRAGNHRGHRTALSGQQGPADRKDRRTDQAQADRGHPLRPRRVRPGGHAHRHRPQKGPDGRVVINQLYKHTQMETSFGIIFLAVVDGRPELLTLKEILEHFIGHRKEIIIRRTRYDLKKAEARAHILEGSRSPWTTWTRWWP